MAEIVNTYPVGIQTFENIREGRYLYVDKTKYIVNFRKKQMKYVFLSRPRRFGKSLFVSTLQAYFEGRKELFEGLAVADYEKEWAKHPVLHFDMSGAKHSDKDSLIRYLGRELEPYEEIYKCDKKDWDTNIRLTNIVEAAYKQTGQKVVVLIDEYDAPLLDVVHEEDNLKPLRHIMRNFYSPLKKLDPYLEFTFITGITKFSQLSIFSELNNITNISMDDEFAGICGITKEEMLEQMSVDIEMLAKSLGYSREVTIAKLKEHYDGYHFSKSSPDVFNPFSLLNCFSKRELGAYWFTSGTPTYLINMMRKFDTLPTDISSVEADESEFDAPTENMTTIMPLLYQSGYITIKDYNRDYNYYTLDVPNKEVKVGLTKALIPSYVTQNTLATTNTARRIAQALDKKDMDGALHLLQNFLGTVPYCNVTNYEGHYQQMLFIIFSLLTDYLVDVEVHTPKGRVDIVLLTKTDLYIIELKLNKDAQTAMQQINLKNYRQRFALSGKPVTKVGINFDSTLGNITDWVIEA